jgi:two-component system sensor histidine kinase KdpD
MRALRLWRVTNDTRKATGRRRTVRICIESLLAVALATGLVSALDFVTPITGLSVVYLLAVLFIAVRWGEIPAAITALASVVALNFFFIPPRYELTVRHSENVVALAVLLVTALAVGRLATAARERADEAEQRAVLAAEREREARMVAAAASSLLDGRGIEGQLRSIELGGGEYAKSRVRIEMTSAPSPEAGEIAIRLPLSKRAGWLYVHAAAGWAEEDRDRIAQTLARLIDIALERERMSATQAEAEATRRAEIVKTAVLHAISHDLRSPLTSITTAAGGLADEEIPARDRKVLVNVIETEAARLSRLVDDLLDLSRIEADAVDPRPDWCDLRDAAISAASQVRALYPDHAIEFNIPLELPLVRADPVQLERVFVNLIDNALKFSAGAQPVKVSGSAGGGRVTIRITNTGGQIPRSKRAHVFEPFARGESSGSGSGLGLAICRGFVEANGGRIALQAPGGEETSFAVSFPLARQPAEA